MATVKCFSTDSSYTILNYTQLNIYIVQEYKPRSFPQISEKLETRIRVL